MELGIKEDFFEHAGPNRVPLFIARVNYLKFGISEPDRTDLLELKDDSNLYDRGREFIWDEKTRTISEPAADWSIILGK